MCWPGRRARCCRTSSWPIPSWRRGRGRSARSCAAWSARTSPSTIPTRPWPRDLRVILRERLLAGDSDRQAIDYIVQRYGNYVLLKPPFEAETLLLWLGPALVLVAGGVWISLLARRRAPGPEPAPALTSDEQEQLARRLGGTNI